MAIKDETLGFAFQVAALNAVAAELMRRAGLAIEYTVEDLHAVPVFPRNVLDLVHESFAGLEFDGYLALCRGFGIDEDTLLREAVRLAHTMGEDATD
jgi:hypothetical protein